MDEQPDSEHFIYPEEIQLPDVYVPASTLFEISSFIARAMEKEEQMASLVKRVLDELYEEIGSPDDAATTIISYIQQRHGWDIELLADKREVEDMMFQRFSRFDEEIWAKVLNTDAISDLHHETYKLSQTYIAYAIDEVLNEEDIDDGGHEHPELDFDEE